MRSQRKMGAVLSYINIISRNLVTFFYTPFLLSHVGQSQYGLFQMTNSVISSLSILSLGLSGAYVKFYVSYKVRNKQRDIDKLNGLYLIMFGIIGIMALLIGLILAFNTKAIFNRSMTMSEIQLTKKLMIIMAINIALTFPSSVFDSNIIVNEQFKFQQIRQMLQSILVPFIAVPLILIGMNVLAIGVTQVFVTLFFLILNVRYCYNNLNMRFRFNGFSFGLVKSLFAFSFFILLNQIVDMINNNAPSFILGITLGAKQVATFAIALQIKNLFFMLSSSLSTIFSPKVNMLVNTSNDRKPILDLMIRVGRIQMSILLFVFGGFIVLGRYFINIWAGSDNIEAYVLIIAMVFPSIIPLSQNIGIEVQRAMNMHIFRSVSYSLFAILNLILTYLGTEIFGLNGSVIGYIVSILFANGFLMNWYYHTKMKIDMKYYWSEVLNVIIPFTIVTFTLLIISKYLLINSIFKFVIFGGAYVIAYFSVFYFFVASNYEKTHLDVLKK
jgi:O-antigen/teichoic acid export membrane protein